MRGTFCRFFLLFALFLGFSACNKATISRLPGNADGSLGMRPKDYYHQDSQTHATIVSITYSQNGEGFTKTLMSSGDPIVTQSSWDAAQGLTQIGSIPWSQIHLSADGNSLTVVGSRNIYEFNALPASQLASNTIGQIAPTVDALCLIEPSGGNIGSTSYSDLKITVSGSAFTLLGENGQISDTLGSTSKLVGNSGISYQIQNWGSLAVNTSQPYSQDSSYFQTAVSAASVGTVSSLYCHPNSINGSLTFNGQASSCAGFSVCDQFSAPNGTALASHTLDTGGSWALTIAVGWTGVSTITGSALDVTTTDTTGSITAYYHTPFGSRDADVSAQLNIGQGPAGEVIGLIARFQDRSNFVQGDVYRDNTLFVYVLRLWEVVGGTITKVAQVSIPAASIIENTFVPAEFRVQGSNYSFTYNGKTITYSSGSNLLTGTDVGIIEGHSGSLTRDAFATLFQAR